MIILFLSNSCSGLYQFRKEIIETLSKNNDVVCSVPNDDSYLDKLSSLGCRCILTKIERRGTNPVSDFHLILEYKRIIKQLKPNLVLSFTVKPNVYGGIACCITKTPYIANVTGLGTAIENGGLLGRFVLYMYKIGLRKAKCVFFQNEENQRLFERLHIVHGDSVLIPGSGVNTSTHFLEEYPDDDGIIRFLFVGRVMKDKGIEELLQAIRILNEEGYKVFLDVVGSCEEDYSSTLTSFEHDGLIKYHGIQTDVHQFYKAANCVVLASYHEGMANVLLEAASCGRPVIATTIPGCQETFEDGVTGIGCEVRNVDSLVSAMKKMVELPWLVRQKMGLAGRKKVCKEFDRSIVVNAYLDHINTFQMAK